MKTYVNNINNIYINRLSTILTNNNVCSSHGIEHAIQVMNNAEQALKCAKFTLTQEQYNCVLLASLLHDADDRKFFPNNFNHENVKAVLYDYNKESLELIIKMISLVSSSKNGDSIPEEAINNEWLLYPRYADRLEALGKGGILRCYQYGITSNNPLYVSTTKCVDKEEDIWSIATIERYNKYNGKSDSMIDHYYDKLLRASFFPIKNDFFDKESNIRRQPLIDIVLFFGKNKKITDIDVVSFTN